MRSRSAVLIYDPQADKVVLIRRFKLGQEYYTFPGGKIEPGETPEEAAIRETHEETGLTITLGEKICVLENLGRTEHYFLANSFSGMLELGCPENEIQSIDNQYHLEWVPIDQVEEINLLPVQARTMVRDAAKR